MSFSDYYLEVATELDINYLPPNFLTLGQEEILSQIMESDLVEYYNTNVSPEKAAEYIAAKLDVGRL